MSESGDDIISVRRGDFVGIRKLGRSKRDLALFNLAIDSKLRACDLVALKPEDVCPGGHIRERTTIIQKRLGGRCSSRSQSKLERR